MQAVQNIELSTPAEKAIANPAADRYLSRARRRSNFVRNAFWVIVMAPTLVAAIYFASFASDRYVSIAQYVVRGQASQQGSGLESLFRTFGLSRTVDDTNAVETYLQSRDAVRDLEARLPLRDIFSRSNGDYFSRFPTFWRFWGPDSFEALYEYYLRRVTVVQDDTRGFTTITADTFSPEDSQNIAKTLMALAEDQVNKMNERAFDNSVSYAEKDLADAKVTLETAEGDLAAFRARQLLVDPAENATKTLENLTALSLELSQTLAQTNQTSRLSPTNPAIAGLKAQTDSLQAQIAQERAKISGSSGDLASKIGGYEKLTLARDLAQKQVASASASLDAARQQAQEHKIYVEEIVRPGLADEPTRPERMRSILEVFVACFGAFAVLWFYWVGISEHSH
jgi:capsular polysaccharide transport system permease protein